MFLRSDYFRLEVELHYMKFLFVIVHPDLTGVSHAHKLAKTAEEGLKAAGHEVRVVELSQAGFAVCAGPNDFRHIPKDKPFNYGNLQKDRENLSKEIRDQQELLLWCTHLVIFGPMWFYKFPACLYAWIERVFTGNWGWDSSKGREELALYGRKALVVITTGSSSEYYSHGGAASLESLIYTTTCSFWACGMDVYRSQGIWDPWANPDKFVADTQKLVKALLNIEKRPLLPFNDPNKPKDLDEIEVLARLPNISLDEAIPA